MNLRRAHLPDGSTYRCPSAALVLCLGAMLDCHALSPRLIAARNAALGVPCAEAL